MLATRLPALPSLSSAARSACCALGLAALAAAPAHAQSSSSNALRAAAVGGTLISWAYAFWEGAPLTDCGGARWQFRGNVAKDDELRLASVGAAYGDCQMLGAGGWSLSHQTNFSVGRWSTSGDVTGASSAWDVAIVPFVHWQRPAFGSTKVEVEFGVGPAWLSQPRIGNREKSTEFQFSDHLGVNLVDGAGQWRVGLHWRHISNLDIKTPNNGVDFAGVVFAWSL